MANYFTEHRNISHFLPNMLIIVDKCWVDKPRRSQGLGKHKHTSSCSHSPVNSSNVYNSMHTIISKHWSQREARGHWGCWRSCSQHDTGYRGRVLSPRPGLMGVSMMRLDTSHPAHCLTINWHKLIGEIRSRSSWQYFSSLNLNIRKWSRFNQPEKNKENLFFYSERRSSDVLIIRGAVSCRCFLLGEKPSSLKWRRKQYQNIITKPPPTLREVLSVSGRGTKEIDRKYLSVCSVTLSTHVIYIYTSLQDICSLGVNCPLHISCISIFQDLFIIIKMRITSEQNELVKIPIWLKLSSAMTNIWQHLQCYCFCAE